MHSITNRCKERWIHHCRPNSDEAHGNHPNAKGVACNCQPDAETLQQHSKDNQNLPASNIAEPAREDLKRAPDQRIGRSQ